MDYKKEVGDFLQNEKEPYGTKLCKINKFIKTILKSVSPSSNASEKALAAIPTSTHFGELTKLEMANELRYPGPIFECWKSENRLFLHRTFQFKWIFTDSSNSPLISDPDFLVNDIFPNVSHSTRKIIVSQLGKLEIKEDAEKISQIYHKIEDVYGYEMAIPLISACDQSLIHKLMIKDKKIKPGHNQLFRIYKKYPELVFEYLNALYEELSNREKRYNGAEPQFFQNRDACPFILQQLAKDKSADFMELYEKYESIISNGDFTLGARLSHRLLKFDKQRILSNGRAYSKILHLSQVSKLLTAQEFDQLFLCIFPNNVQEFPATFEMGSPAISTWMEKYEPIKRFQKLDTAFKTTYGKSLLDFPEFVTSKIILLLSAEERDKWVDMRLSKINQYSQDVFSLKGFHHYPIHMEGYWEAFRSTDKSIPKIKQYLSTEADIQRRGDLLASLVIACFINNDTEALKEVCQFVSTRYRNDGVQVRMEFLSAVASLFDLLKLDEHWKPINELLHISSINEEFSCRLQLMESILEKSIIFRMKRDLPVDTQIKHYIKMKTKTYCRGESWCMATNESALERKCLTLFAEHLSAMFPLTTPCPSDSSTTSAIISLLESFAGWNRRNCQKSKTNEILTATDFPWLIKRLQSILSSYHEGNKQRVVQSLNHDPPAKALLNPQLLKTCAEPRILCDILAKNPQQLDESSDAIIDFILSSNHVEQWKNFFQKFRISGLPKLAEKYANKCLEIAEDEEESLKERSNSIFILSFLLQPSNFVDWTSKFNPPEDTTKLDMYTDEEIGVFYGLRKRICQSLSNLSTPSTAIPSLLIFCKGDYLKLVIGSLYSVAKKMPQSIKLIEFLKEISSRAVSVKKHGIRLMLHISTKTDNIAFLQNLWEVEKHHSIRAIVFREILLFFLQNNSDEAWNLLKSCITSLTNNDEPLFRELGVRRERGIPDNKLSQYLGLTIKQLDQVGFGESYSKVNILWFITSINIKFIEETLLEEIFEKHLFTSFDPSTHLPSAAVTVAINYFLYYPNSTKKMEILTKYLERLVGKAWTNLLEDSIMFVYPAKQALSSFIELLTTESFKIEGKDSKAPKNLDEIKNIIIQLQKFLRSSHNVCEFFVDDLFLSFSSIFHKHLQSKNEDDCSHLLEIGKEVGILVDQLVEAHNPHIVSIISESLKRFVTLCYQNRLRKNGVKDGTMLIYVIEGILESTGSLNTQIVATQFLMSSTANIPPKGHPMSEKYSQLLNKLNGSGNETVQIFVNYRSRRGQSPMAYGEVLI